MKITSGLQTVFPPDTSNTPPPPCHLLCPPLSLSLSLSLCLALHFPCPLIPLVPEHKGKSLWLERQGQEVVPAFLPLAFSHLLLKVLRNMLHLSFSSLLLSILVTHFQASFHSSYLSNNNLPPSTRPHCPYFSPSPSGLVFISCFSFHFFPLTSPGKRWGWGCSVDTRWCRFHTVCPPT